LETYTPNSEIEKKKKTMMKKITCMVSKHSLSSISTKYYQNFPQIFGSLLAAREKERKDNMLWSCYI